MPKTTKKNNKQNNGIGHITITHTDIPFYDLKRWMTLCLQPLASTSQQIIYCLIIKTKDVLF